MKQVDLNDLIRKAEDRKLALRQNKGAEYTRGDADVLANFKRVASGVGLSPLQVWWVYFHKHVDALASFVRTGAEASDEGIEGRVDDLQVYLDLVRGLIAEHKTPAVPAAATKLDEVFAAMRADGQGLTLGQETSIRTAVGR